MDRSALAKTGGLITGLILAILTLPTLRVVIGNRATLWPLDTIALLSYLALVIILIKILVDHLFRRSITP